MARSKLNRFEHVEGGGSGFCMGTPVNRQTDRLDWKHYLPANSLAGVNK